MKLSSMNYLFRQGMKNIWTHRIMSLASFCILMVSLLLIGSAIIFVSNINVFIGSVENKNEVIIFLNDGLSADRIEQMGSKLKNMDNVSECFFYSRDAAFEDLKKDMGDYDDLFQYIGDESPLPDSYRIRVKNIGNMSSTLMSVNRLEGIYSVKAPNDFVNILTELRGFVSVIFAALMTALVIVCLVIISNTARASVDMRKREISIMKLVGATNSFIKIPFFAEGMTIGMLAGLTAAVVTCVGYTQLGSVITSDMTMWSAMGFSGLIPLKDIIVRIITGYVLTGALISAAGTVMSTAKYVRV